MTESTAPERAKAILLANMLIDTFKQSGEAKTLDEESIKARLNTIRFAVTHSGDMLDAILEVRKAECCGYSSLDADYHITMEMPEAPLDFWHSVCSVLCDLYPFISGAHIHLKECKHVLVNLVFNYRHELP